MFAYNLIRKKDVMEIQESNLNESNSSTAVLENNDADVISVDNQSNENNNKLYS